MQVGGRSARVPCKLRGDLDFSAQAGPQSGLCSANPIPLAPPICPRSLSASSRDTGRRSMRGPIWAHDSGRSAPFYSSTFRMAMKASWGTSTLPMAFMRFLPAFCFSNNLRLRVMSPP